MKSFIVFCVCFTLSYGVNAYPGDIQFKQPDGTRFQAKLKGDEHFHWIELPNGETALFNQKSKRYEHAIVQTYKGKARLVASGKEISPESSKKPTHPKSKISKQVLYDIWKQKASQSTP